MAKRNRPRGKGQGPIDQLYRAAMTENGEITVPEMRKRAKSGDQQALSWLVEYETKMCPYMAAESMIELSPGVWANGPDPEKNKVVFAGVNKSGWHYHELAG